VNLGRISFAKQRYFLHRRFLPAFEYSQGCQELSQSFGKIRGQWFFGCCDLNHFSGQVIEGEFWIREIYLGEIEAGAA
jgi:hypothetical protein